MPATFVWLSQRPRLALESSQPLGVLRQMLGQRLDRHRAVELRVAAQIDDAHAAATDLAFEGVGADLGGLVHVLLDLPETVARPARQVPVVDTNRHYTSWG